MTESIEHGRGNGEAAGAKSLQGEDLSREYFPQLKKIFGLGIGRTATKSLTEGLVELGHHCLHWAPDRTTAAEVITGARVSRIAEARDAVIDTILPLLHYREYAERFPDAKFILTSREPHSWLRSIRRHMIGMRTQDACNHSAELYGSLILNGWSTGKPGDEQLLEAYSTHNRAVRDFFADKPGRLLEMDIVAGDGWEKLCPFLEQESPRTDFPDMKKPDASRPDVYNAALDKNVLALGTMILPRMEVDHLEEWIRWHYLNGIRHIWIVCDKPDIQDVALGQRGGQTWEKKPWANFNLHLSDWAARERIDQIVRECELRMPFLNVRVYDIDDFSHRPDGDIAARQITIANKVAAMAVDLVDWIGFIDIDELLSRECIGQLGRIAETAPEVATVRMMRQQLMGNRFVDGEARMFCDITESWGVIPDASYTYRGNGKSFVRPGQGEWISPHRAQAIAGGVDMKSTEMWFYHFHGVEATSTTLSVGWDKIYQWAKDNAPRQEHDGHTGILRATRPDW